MIMFLTKDVTTLSCFFNGKGTTIFETCKRFAEKF